MAKNLGAMVAKRAAEREQGQIVAPEANSPKVGGGKASGMTGTASGSRSKALQERLDEISSKILKGQLSIELDPAQVKESIGSDRLEGWEKDADFASLKENMRARGQTQPIRVRPADPAWKPTENNPTEIPSDVEFFVQSGRRRLAACRELGIQVLAIITNGGSSLIEQSSTEDEKAELSDLEERFAENTIRKSLSPLERLLSIGQIASRLAEEHLKQAEIGERLHVKQAEVSQSLKLWRDWEAGGESRQWFSNNPSTIVLRDYIPQLGKGRDAGEVAQEIASKMVGVQPGLAPEPAEAEASKASNGVKKVAPKVRKHSLFNGSSFAVSRSFDGIKVTAKALAIPKERQDDFERDLKDLLERYQGGN